MSVLSNAVDTGNSIIDRIQAIANNPIVSMIGMGVPQVGLILNLLQRYSSVIDTAQPIIKAAVEAGEPVFDKVIEQLPQFGKVVAKITALLPSVAHPEVLVETIARGLGNFGRMTPEQELKWMKDTAGTDPSEENSRIGSG